MALLLVGAGFCGFKGLLPSQEAGHRGETVAAVGPSDNAVVVGGVRYRPIETYRVCDRVLGRNPELTDEDRALFGPEPDPATWKRLTLRAPKTDGSTAEVEMVRPPEWLAEHRPEVGKTVPIWVPECGIEGEAEVLSIGPCPPVKPGNGPVVLATFRHVVSSTVDLHVTGLDQPIGCTPNHPFWSQDRGQFVRADELKPGEHLSALGPDAYVERLALDPTPKPVYNLQVQGEHVYQVSGRGVLVHNGKICPLGKAGKGPLHHLVTKYGNTSRGWRQNWSRRSRDILDKAHVGLESGWNKVYLRGHYGPHPEAYHKRIFERLAKAVRGKRPHTNAYTQAVQRELRKLGRDLLGDVTKLNGPRLL